MRVIDLTRQAGNFETCSVSAGRRTYGLWSYAEPQPGDLVVIQRVGFKVTYRVQTARCDFTGSNGDSFWRGEMVDANAMFDRNEIALLVEAGLA